VSGFASPIVGGGGTLVYPSIHSPNFIPGVSGWTVRRDGSAEFSDVIIRGTIAGNDWVLTSSGLYMYNGAAALGTLIASVLTPAAAGTDPVGNSVLVGVTAYSGGAANLTAVNLWDNGQLRFMFAATPGGAWVNVGSMQGGPSALNLTIPAAVIFSLLGTAELSQAAVFGLTARNPNTGGTQEIWHQVGAAGQPAFGAGWSNSGAGAGLAYQYRADASVDIAGDLSVPSNPNGTVIFTLPAAWRPASTQQLDVTVITSTGAAAALTPRAFCGTSGAVTAQNLPAGTTRIFVHGKLCTDL
jgi:hypothetical protein